MSGLFINVSNHPTTAWSGEQLRQAKYGEEFERQIIDIPFPAVDPTWERYQVHACAAGVVSEIKALLPDHWVEERLEGDDWNAPYLRARERVIVHVMGESGLTHAIVNRLLALKRCPLRVVHSTTQRTVVERPDGTKESRFLFVRFRDY